MVTFSGVRTFLVSQSASPEMVELVSEFFEEFRRGACYLHPFDDGDHAAYFNTDEIKLTQLLLVKFHLVEKKVKSQLAVLCFDGKRYELSDAHALFNRFLPYRDSLERTSLNWQTFEKYVRIRPRWCGFWLGHDHEGPLYSAIYSPPIKPSQGITLLNDAMHYRFITP